MCIERHFAGSCELVWGLLSDTNRYNRAMGLGIPSYVWQLREGHRMLVGRSNDGGVTLRWTQEPFEWIEGRMFRAQRIFFAGPAKSGSLRIDLEDTADGEGCVARITVTGAIRSRALRVFEPLVRGHLRRKIVTYMEGIAAVVADGRALLDELRPELPASVRAKMLLLGSDRQVVVGGISPVDQEALARRAERMTTAPVDQEIVQRLVSRLASRPDEEVSQMRPFELARQWDCDRRSVLRVFLHATREGLVDLNWQINCPVCRVSAEVVTTLGEIGRDVHCQACNIAYDVDFGANVEAVFRSNRAIRDVEPAIYCAASPVFRPHIFAQLRADPGPFQEHELHLHDGRLHLRTLGEQRSCNLQGALVPAEIEVEIDARSVHVEVRGESVDGITRLRLRSAGPEPEHLLIERGAWASDAVLGSVVASLPEFVDLFATEAPAAGLELTISTLTFLFSDLTGSTALYEKLGDARAFAIVQEHFALMEAAVSANGGAVIKTMGDAVMASFSTPCDAIRAAVWAVRRTQVEHGQLEIGVKLGVHEGPCLAVRANDRLDFFGTTVNLTARLQGQARAGELVLMREIAERPKIAEQLAEFPARVANAHLKGIAAEQPLLAVDLRESPDGSERSTE